MRTVRSGLWVRSLRFGFSAVRLRDVWFSSPRLTPVFARRIAPPRRLLAWSYPLRPEGPLPSKPRSGSGTDHTVSLSCTEVSQGYQIDKRSKHGSDTIVETSVPRGAPHFTSKGANSNET